MSELIIFNRGARVRWSFAKLREMLANLPVNTAPNPQWTYFSIEVYVPKGPYSIYGGIEAMRLEDGMTPFVDICDLEAIGDRQTLIGEGDEVALGLSGEFREHLTDSIISAKLKYPVALTDAINGIAGSSTHLFDTLVNIVSCITSLESTDSSMVNSVIASQLRSSGAISEDARPAGNLTNRR